MSEAPDYLIEVDGLHNLRAVEGYAVAGGRMRPGRLYRSGAWELVSEQGRAWLDANVRTVIDLRHPDEVTGAASSRRGPPPAGLVAHSIFRADVSMAEFVNELNSLSGDGISSERYLDYLRIGAADRFARAVELLADESNYPVLVNCTAGKDRTGLLIAMVMDLIGASDEDIGTEYERSNAGIDGLIAYLSGHRPHPPRPSTPRNPHPHGHPRRAHPTLPNRPPHRIRLRPRPPAQRRRHRSHLQRFARALGRLTAEVAPLRKTSGFREGGPAPRRHPQLRMPAPAKAEAS